MSFLEQSPDCLLLAEDKKATLSTHYGVCDNIFHNLAVLNYLDQQVPLVYPVLSKALSNEPIFDTFDWKSSMLPEA